MMRKRPRRLWDPEDFAAVRRFLVIDFETVGWGQGALPRPNFPTEVCVAAVCRSLPSVAVLLHTLVRGAVSLSPIAAEKTGIRLEALETAPSLDSVLDDMEALVRPGDCVVCHNAQYDMEAVLRPCRPDHALLALPRMCTMRRQWQLELPGRSLRALAEAWGVAFDESRAHGARYDVEVLSDVLVRAERSGSWPAPA